MHQLLHKLLGPHEMLPQILSTRLTQRLLAYSAWKCDKPPMCFHATIAGEIVPVWSKTAYDEVMLHCARIGFKP